MTDAHHDFYHKLREKIAGKPLNSPALSKIREFLLLAPDLFYLLIQLLRAPEIEIIDKGKILAAVTYFISPIDLLPEAFLGLAGYADDIVVAAMILNPIIRKYPDVVEREWAGGGDVLSVVRTILSKADELVGQKILNALKKLFK